MVETLSVSLSGPAFSFLLYENMKCSYSQEGFLLGEIVEKETRTITDNDQRQVHVSRVVKINSSVPCPHLHYFYDGIGRVDVEKIKNFLGDLSPKVVAWYKYHTSSSFNFNFRERLVHKQLANLFDLAPEFFTCCFLISESSDNGSTHSYTQNFLRYHNNSYEQLPLHIVNLSDANNTYKSPEHVSDTFLNIVEGLKINHKKSQGLTIITKIQNALQKHTGNLVQNLSEAEKRLFELENDIKKIKEVVKAKDLTSASNKESQLNSFITMDTNSVEENTFNNSNDDFVTKNSARGRGKSVPAKGKKKPSQSPSRKSAQEGNRSVTTRSRKTLYN